MTQAEKFPLSESSNVSATIHFIQKCFRRRRTIQFGLLLLIATPIARVVFSVFAFWRQHDRVYVFVTLFVLIVLLYSLIGGDP